MAVTLLLQDVKDNKAEAASAAPQALRLCQMVGLITSPAQSQMCYSCSNCHDCNWIADLCSQLHASNLSVALCYNSVAEQMHVSLQVMLVELLGCMPAIDANAAVFNRRHGLIVMHASQKDDLLSSMSSLGRAASFSRPDSQPLSSPSQASMLTW